MFTGLIESIGTVSSILPKGNYVEITISPKPRLENYTLGESIAVAGTCLTVTKFSADSFTAEASQETVRLTTIGALKKGNNVNLERAMKAGGRLGGHMVAGHIDEKLRVTKKRQVGQSLQISVELPDDFKKYVIDKGSVSLNGVSLTVIELDNKQFTVNLIPESQSRTTLPELSVGDEINVEFDLVGKYILRSLEVQSQRSSLSIKSMRNMGY
ncbi:MAG: riboflavin synthase [candidate division Zixibacteria bacterium]|nr:riboflavin synthase [candidate division Zixibacteria bacterium]